MVIHMFIEIQSIIKPFLTLIAMKSKLSQMYPHVSDKSAYLGECSITFSAGKYFPVRIFLDRMFSVTFTLKMCPFFFLKILYYLLASCLYFPSNCQY